VKLLFLTHGTWLNPAVVASGNSVRGYWLVRGLSEQGVTVVWCYPQALGPVGDAHPLPGVSVCAYTDPGDLAERIRTEAPDVVLVGYWELLDALPESLHLPIVLDVVAPRILEVMYEDASQVDGEIQRMLRLYRRVDRFLAGNQRQRYFLLPWLILAGFDLRADIPVDVVPISTEPGSAVARPPDPTQWIFVAGGVDWPWRRTEPFLNKLLEGLEQLASGIRGELHRFSGRYVYGGHGSRQPETLTASACIRQRELLPYGEMQRFLHESAHIGVELAEHNIEREFSQAFRAVDSLGAGRPLIISGYTELAEQVRRYDAGWSVDSPEELPALIATITADPQAWAHKSANALRLVTDLLDYRRTVQPLLNYLHAPYRPPRTLPRLTQATTLPSASVQLTPQRPARLTRIKHRIVGLLQTVLTRLPRRGEPVIMLISRSDIFPTDHGAAVKIERTAWGLSQTGVTVLLVTDEHHRYYRYRKGVCETLTFPLGLRGLAPPLRWVRERLLRKGVPAEEAFFYYPLTDWSFILRVCYLAARHPVLLFQAEFPAYARPALWGRSLFGGKTLLVEHNVEFQRLSDQFPQMSESTRLWLRDTEVLLANSVDAVIAVSERDRSDLAAAGVAAGKIHYVPHGVDLAAFDAGPVEDVRRRFALAADRPILVYHGIYSYPPNYEAMQVMAQELLPRLNELGVHPLVLAIGRNPPAAPLHPDIVFTGSVERVAPWLRAADMAVVPLVRGGGTRMKILDYFAACLPVVSTTKGIEGIECSHGLDAWVEDDYSAMAAAIARLLADPAQAQAMARRGRALAERLDWPVIARRYRDIVDV